MLENLLNVTYWENVVRTDKNLYAYQSTLVTVSKSSFHTMTTRLLLEHVDGITVFHIQLKTTHTTLVM